VSKSRLPEGSVVTESGTGQPLLFLHATTGGDDADATLLDLVRGIDRARWRPIVALPHDGPLASLLRSAGAHVEYGPLGVLEPRTLRSPLGLSRFALQLPRALRFVRGLVQRHRPALIHTTTSTVVGGALGARLSGARHLWHLDETCGLPAWAERALTRVAARLADVVVSSSNAARQSLDRHAPELAARHRVVHCGIDRDRLGVERIERETARRELDVAAHTTLIVLVGRVEAWKGHALLLEVAERLRFRHPDAVFLLVGDAPRGEGQRVRELREEIEHRNLTGYVRHLPQQSDNTRVLVAADLVVVPSTRPEAFGHVAAEAMACARPVVAAAHGGILEVVDPGVTGLVFEPGDAEKLAWALKVLIEDRGRAREMGRKGAARQTELFSHERVRREMDRLWSQVVARPFTLPASEAQIVHFVLGGADSEPASEIEHRVHQLAAAQAARGLAVSVIGISEQVPATLARPYPFRLFPAARGRFALAPELVAALDTFPTTALVHLHGGFVPTLRALGSALARRRIPYVLTPHGAYRTLARRRGGLRQRAYAWRHERRLLRGARGVQAFSEPERNEMKGLVDLDEVAVVPHGQDVLGDMPALDTTAVRRPLYGYCGRLARDVDGVDVLVRAFTLHTAGGGEGTLWLIGDGDDRPRLEAEVHGLGLARRIVFVGEQTDAERLARLQALDVLVQPSGREGLLTRALEAAALGRAIVVTSDTCIGREVRQHGAGFVLERADGEQLAATLSACEREWQAGNLAQRGVSARAMVAAHFVWSLVEPQLCRDLYELDDHDLAPLASPAPEASRNPAEHGDRRRIA
jgi:glycosyltransferase involved in cell wall biosynthesis